MINITDHEKLFSFCYALSSPIRIQIVSILSKLVHTGLSMSEIAAELGITNGALTPHIKYLENANIIYIKNVNAKHGVQKKCFLKELEYQISLRDSGANNNYNTELPIGSYSNHSSSSICGLATSINIIGLLNDPRYFDDPTRLKADMIWFTNGFIQYKMPNYLQYNQKLSSITISQEISLQSSERSGNGGELVFSLNQHDFPIVNFLEEKDGIASQVPSWLDKTELKPSGSMYCLSITKDGTYFNDKEYSSITINDIDIYEGLPIKYKITSKDCTCILYGSNLGKYPQGIMVQMQYE